MISFVYECEPPCGLRIYILGQIPSAVIRLSPLDNVKVLINSPFIANTSIVISESELIKNTPFAGFGYTLKLLFISISEIPTQLLTCTWNTADFSHPSGERPNTV